MSHKIGFKVDILILYSWPHSLILGSCSGRKNKREGKEIRGKVKYMFLFYDKKRKLQQGPFFHTFLIKLFSGFPYPEN